MTAARARTRCQDLRESAAIITATPATISTMLTNSPRSLRKSIRRNTVRSRNQPIHSYSSPPAPWAKARNPIVSATASLYLGVATVRPRVSRILARLELNNRVQIALLVHDARLLDTDGEGEGGLR